MIKKDIKKVLKETKELKENLLIKETIVKNRIKMIFENDDNIKNFNSLPESKKIKLGFLFLTELSYLKDSDLINEADLGSMLKGIFGNLLSSAPEALIFEPMFNSILSAIGIPDGIFRKSVVSFLATNPAKLIEAVRSCEGLTKLIVKSIIEGMVMQLQQTKGFGGLAYDLIRDSLGGALESVEIVQKLENGLASTICNLFDKFTNNAKNVSEKLKPEQ